MSDISTEFEFDFEETEKRNKMKAQKRADLDALFEEMCILAHKSYLLFDSGQYNPHDNKLLDICEYIRVELINKVNYAEIVEIPYVYLRHEVSDNTETRLIFDEQGINVIFVNYRMVIGRRD